MKISLIFPCKNRLAHVQECIGGWVDQTHRDIEFIFVDYNCPQFSAQWIRKEHPSFRILKAKVAAKEWNLCAARNIGIKAATGSLIGIFDADTIMSRGFIQDCIDRIEEDSFMCGQPIGKAHGCCIGWAKHFRAVGGYNEFLQGWGFDDADIYNRFMNASLHERNPVLRYIDLKMHGFDENLIDLIRHEDTLRVEYQKYKNIQSTNHINSHTALHSRRFRGLESDAVKYTEL